MSSIVKKYNFEEWLENWKRLSGGAVGVAGLVYVLIKFYSLLPEKKITSYKIQYDLSKNYGGRLFAEVFKNHGVKVVFTLTGGHIAPILVGCNEAGIKVVDVRHEVNTAFAADAVSRLTGIPGVAIVTAGPGVTNTITAVKNAQMAQSPLIIIGGATSDLLKGKGSLQDIDQFALMKPHVKWMAHITAVKDIVPILETAFKVSRDGTPGPVFIEIPLDVLYKEETVKSFYANASKGTGIVATLTKFYLNRHISKMFSDLKEVTFHKPLTVTYPLASASQINQVVNYLKQAKKPIMIIGSQAILDNEHVVSGELTDAIIKMGIPTFLTGMARGLLRQHSNIQLKQKMTRRKALYEADVIIFLGLPLDFRFEYGTKVSRRAKYIAVNRDQTDLYKNWTTRYPDYAVLGDPCHLLLKISEVLGDTATKNWAEWHQSLTTLELEEEKKLVEQDKEKEHINALFLSQELDKAMSKEAIIVADGGDVVGTAAYVLKPRSPLSWLDPGAFGTLGVGAGFAMGAQLCRPESEVWILYGDGALGFSIAEFDTFARHKIPIIAVVGNDACWKQIQRDQVQIFNDDTGCALAFTDYHTVVKGFGGEGFVVHKRDELGSTLAKARDIAKQQKKPVLVNVIMAGKTNFREGSISM